MLAVGTSMAPALARAAAEAPGVSAKTITVGAWSPLSGPAALYSEITDGAQAYFDDLNAHGGIDHHIVRYVVLNDQLNPALTVGVARELIQQYHVFAIVGGVGSTTGKAAMPILNRYGVPVIPSAGAPFWSSPLKPNWYAAYPNYLGEGRLQAEYAVKILHAKKIGIIYQNDAIGIPGKDAAIAELKRLGIRPVATVAYNPSDTQFTSYVLTLQHAGAQVVISWSLVAQTASILKAAQNIGYRPKWILSSFNVDPSLIKLAGSAAEGALIADYLPLPNAANQKRLHVYLAAMHKYFPNVQPGMLSEQGWEFAEIFTYGARQALAHGALTRSSFENALNHMRDYNTDVIYKLSYSPTDHSGPKYEFFAEVKNGTFVQASPYEAIPVP